MRATRASLTALVIAIALVSARSVHGQEHDHQFFFSDDAALAAGAVAATTDDSGAVYYNPAGLSLNRRSQADLKASAFGVRIRSVDGIMSNRLAPNAPSLRLRTVDIISTPHAAGITRRLGEHTSVGFGFYVVDYDVRAGEDTTEQTDPGNGRFTRHHVDVDLQRSKYVFGPAIGWQISPTVRLGVSLNGTYTRGASGGRIVIDQAQPGTNPAQVGYFFLHFRGSASGIGARATVGLQWDFLPAWTFAAVARTPELQVAAWGSQLSAVSGGSSITGEVVPPSFTLTENRATNSFSLSRPPLFLVSLARKVGRGFVSAELDVQPPLRIISQGIDRETTINGRIGGTMYLSPSLSLGAGFFTDRAMLPLSGGLPAERLDYYGVTLGGQLRTALPLARKAEDEPLMLTTTVALRAAVGIGEARTYDIEQSGFVPKSTDVVFYELVPYFGSGIIF